MIFDQQTLLYLACSQLTTSIYWPAIVLSKFMLSLLFAIVSGPFGWKGICASFLKLLVYFYIDVVDPIIKGGGFEIPLCSLVTHRIFLVQTEHNFVRKPTKCSHDLILFSSIYYKLDSMVKSLVHPWILTLIPFCQ